VKYRDFAPFFVIYFSLVAKLATLSAPRSGRDMLIQLLKLSKMPFLSS